ncbi:MAG: hypothetical protein K6T78_07850 [Alicyclobacillus sp.]|nr:hypothetical protein [Alicyclobacillus sp.]
MSRVEIPLRAAAPELYRWVAARFAAAGLNPGDFAASIRRVASAATKAGNGDTDHGAYAAQAAHAFGGDLDEECSVRELVIRVGPEFRESFSYQLPQADVLWLDDGLAAFTDEAAAACQRAVVAEYRQRIRNQSI